MDKQLKNLMKTPQNSKAPTLGYIRKFRLEEVGLPRYLQEMSINYTKINYVLCNSNKIADLSQKHLTLDYVYSELQKNKAD